MGYLPDKKEAQTIINQTDSWLKGAERRAEIGFVQANYVSLHRRCRAHFVAEMRPQFLPEGWDIDFKGEFRE